MGEKKKKSRGEPKFSDDKKINKHKQSKTLTGKKNKDGERRKRTGPSLPNALRKELNRLNPNVASDNEDADSDEGVDLYEYDEGVPHEESGRNRRFDAVENFEYELPEEFEDENVQSDDEDDGSDEDEDNDRHARMLQGITGIPTEAFEGKKKKKSNFVISETYPESEYNPSHDVLDGEGGITIKDLLDPLHGKSGHTQLTKRMRQMEKKSMVMPAPLPKADQERLERKAAYEQSKKDITKWEPLVKRNREAPTVYFGGDTDLGVSTIGAIASEFEPRTNFEKKIASIVYDPEVMDAHRKDGYRLLELNKVSIEDEKDRRNNLAKMRSLLFRHELKAKHIKNIKSKTYHRLLKKDRVKAAAQISMDPEAAKELAMKQEYKRAEERMTLKHKNSSKWAKRILKRGLDVQDEGTRAAISEQLHHHNLLTRKMNSMKESSSSDDSSGDDDIDENSYGSDQDGSSKLLAKAKEKTLKILEEEDEAPKSGVLSLPFMVRGMKKRKDAAEEEARLALQEYDSTLSQLVDKSGARDHQPAASSGRRVFGVDKKPVPEPNNREKTDNYFGNSDSEDDLNGIGSFNVGNVTNDFPKSANFDSVSLHEDPKSHQESVFKTFDDVVRDPGPKTSYEVSIFASDTWRKMKSDNESGNTNIKKARAVARAEQNPDSMEECDDSDTDSAGQMVDGILSSAPKPSYKLPSREELMNLAFAGDDVEEDFEKDKTEVLNEENPEPEKPVLLPGWGQWTNVQKKKGLPSWMLEEHKTAKKKREEALKKRKDAHLQHVIISEKLDKKAEKLHTKSLPYPFTSKEVFEQSIRMPIGPEFNPATAAGALIRPEVIKKPGVIIEPIKFEEVNVHEKGSDGKSNGAKNTRNMKKRKLGKV